MAFLIWESIPFESWRGVMARLVRHPAEVHFGRGVAEHPRPLGTGVPHGTPGTLGHGVQKGPVELGGFLGSLSWEHSCM